MHTYIHAYTSTYIHMYVHTFMHGDSMVHNDALMFVYTDGYLHAQKSYISAKKHK